MGTPVGDPATADLSADGGQLRSSDGRLTLNLPPGALPAGSAVQLSMQEVTNTAPGGIGKAWRLAPEGQTFAKPVSLTFTVEGLDGGLGGLTVAFQEGQGYWLRLPAADVTRDEAARTVTARTTHFSGWSLVTTDSNRDLQGNFTYSSSLDVPFTGATGTASFSWAGEDPGVSYYLLAGSITLPTPVVDGAKSCTPTPPETPTLALRTNVAELRTSPAAFFWGMSGHWNLTCDGPGGTSSELLLTAFDTQGISHPTCTRAYEASPAPVFGPDRVAGAFLVDCGAMGQSRAGWDFTSSRCGQPCTASQPCALARWDCTSGTAACVDTGLVPDGQPGSCPSPQTCQRGACTP